MVKETLAMTTLFEVPRHETMPVKVKKYLDGSYHAGSRNLLFRRKKKCCGCVHSARHHMSRPLNVPYTDTIALVDSKDRNSLFTRYALVVQLLLCRLLKWSR